MRQARRVVKLSLNPSTGIMQWHIPLCKPKYSILWHNDASCSNIQLGKVAKR